MRFSAVSLAAAAMAAASVVSAQTNTLGATPGNNPFVGKVKVKPVTNSWIAVFADGPVSSAESQAKVAEVVQEAKNAGIPVAVKHTFEIFPGASVNVEDKFSEKLGNLTSVKHLYKMQSYSLPRVNARQININNRSMRTVAIGQRAGPADWTSRFADEQQFAHNLTGVNTVHTELGFTGKGIKVGIIDTGVDYTHPGLGGCFGPSCRVTTGFDVVGDAYDSNTNNNPQAGPDPQDRCGSGHGTHVAGIIGANDVAKKLHGVAPDVTFGAYKVFGCGEEPSTADDVMMIAMEAAYKDGMDVINMSIGGGAAWESSASGALGTLLAGMGMQTAGAAGNSGTSGMWQNGSPAIGTDVLDVAAADNYAVAVHYGLKLADGTTVPRSDDTDAQFPFTFQNATAVLGVDASGSNLGCAPLVNAKGKIAFINRGSCFLYQKLQNAQAGGAIGAVIINRDENILSFGSSGLNITIPGATVTKSGGDAILKQIAAPISNVPFKSTVKVTTGGSVSSFSSYGPGPRLETRPDILAPGDSILSTMPIRLGTYGFMSGTSMATPYIAGSTAVVAQVFGKRKTAEYRQRLTNNAVPQVRANAATHETVARQGAGLVNVLNAITSRTALTPNRIALNDTGVFDMPFTTKWFSVKNNGNHAVTYQLSHAPAESISSFDANGNYVEAPTISATAATVQFYQSEFTLQPGQAKDVGALFTAPKLPPASFFVYSGHIVVTPVNDNVVIKRADGSDYTTKQAPLSLPYLGLRGDYKKYPMFDTANGFPFVASGATNSPIPAAGATFSLKALDIPVAVVRILHQTYQLNIRVLDAKTGKSLGFTETGYQTETDRNTNDEANQYWSFTWKGGVVQAGDLQTAKPVPDGVYKLRVEALKMTGNPKNINDYYTWTSAPITIKRA